jgi:hypothetical protein
MQPLLKKLDQCLCLVNPENNSILKKHVPDNKILDWKVINEKVIVQEKPTTKLCVSNIYCLDLDFNILWHSDLPFPEDCYPNPIIWDSKINKASISWEDAYLIVSTSFTTASLKGITVSIDYNTGKIEDSMFTK